jgi:hypothetical protein
MNWIEKQAAFYRGYLTDERSLVPLTIVLATVVAVWLLVYLVARISRRQRHAEVDRRFTSTHCIGVRSAVSGVLLDWELIDAKKPTAMKTSGTTSLFSSP